MLKDNYNSRKPHEQTDAVNVVGLTYNIPNLIGYLVAHVTETEWITDSDLKYLLDNMVMKVMKINEENKYE